MQFLVIAYDGTDKEAMQRRLAVREAHLAMSEKMAQEGKQLYGAAILDDNGTMIGSTMIYELPSRTELDAVLALEPYVMGNVWQNIEIRLCRVGPAYMRT